MHIIQRDNITIAHATPLTTPNRTIIRKQHQQTHPYVQITRGDLLSTSKYYQYHKAMGHTPQHIQQVSGKQKNDFLLKVVFRHTCTNKSISFKTNKKKQMHSRCPHSTGSAGALLSEGELWRVTSKMHARTNWCPQCEDKLWLSDP